MIHHPLWNEAWTPALVNHLWQSTLFVLIAWMVTLILKNNQARTRYWIWMIASIKFLIPFSILISAGEFLASVASEIPSPGWAAVVEQIAQPFPQASSATLMVFQDKAPALAAPAANPLSWILPAVWFCGFVGCFILWARSWSRIRDAVRSSTKVWMLGKVPVLSSRELHEPSVFGVFRPVLLLPQAAYDRLSESHLKAIVAHEMCHVARHDNLTTAIHMIVQALFWFNPAMWWIKARLLDERERACDEAVLLSGTDAHLYAESILKICRLCVESPLACASGVSGAGLKQRIVRIMTKQIARRLDFSRKLLLSIVGAAALALPIILGFAHIAGATVDNPVRDITRAFNLAPSPTPSQKASKPSFDVVSIKQAADCRDREWPLYRPGGRYKNCGPLSFLIREAFNMTFHIPLEGVPDWSKSINYSIEAKAEGTPSVEQMHLMVQSLLEDRFNLRMHSEKHEAKVYFLSIAKGGHKLQPAKDELGNPIASLPTPEEINSRIAKQPSGRSKSIDELINSMPPGSIIAGVNSHGSVFFAKAMKMKDLADSLAGQVGNTTIIDKTGLTGLYDINLKFLPANLIGTNPPASTEESSTPDIFIALQEQLGLKLVPGKGMVDHFIIDSVDKPPEN